MSIRKKIACFILMGTLVSVVPAMGMDANAVVTQFAQAYGGASSDQQTAVRSLFMQNETVKTFLKDLFTFDSKVALKDQAALQWLAQKLPPKSLDSLLWERHKVILLPFYLQVLALAGTAAAGAATTYWCMRPVNEKKARVADDQLQNKDNDGVEQGA